MHMSALRNNHCVSVCCLCLSEKLEQAEETGLLVFLTGLR